MLAVYVLRREIRGNMYPDPNARPPYTGPGQPPGPYDPNQYGTPPPPPGQGGTGTNPPYNPYGTPNQYTSDVPPTVAATPNQYTPDVPPTVAATPGPYAQYAPPPVHPGQSVPPMPPMQNQYQGQFNYPQTPFSPPQPRRSTGRIVLLSSVVVVICALVVSLLAAGLSSYQAKKNAVATATAVASAYPFSANLVLNDSMIGNSTNPWAKASTCAFKADGYHVTQPNADMNLTCFNHKTVVRDFTYQATVELTSTRVAGLVFRADAKVGSSYEYIFSQGGSVILALTKDYSGGKELFHSNNSGWKIGQKNTVAVVARGNSFTLYVNGKEVSKGVDKNNTYSSGWIGLLTSNFGPEADEAAFTNVKVWAL